MNRKIRTLVGGAIVALLFGGFFYSVMDSGVGALQYYHTLGEFDAAVKAGRIEAGQGMRLNGNVVEGSIDRDLRKMQISFEMTDGSAVLPVLLTRVDVSDLFKDGAQVVVEGHYRADGVFEAEQLQAKCPTKYEAEEEKTAANSSSSRTL